MASDFPSKYRIEESDLAEADRTAAFLHVQWQSGPEYADVWHRGLLTVIQSLAEFPGPLSNPIVRKKTPAQSEIRRLLYRGSGKRRSRMQSGYRILYTVIELSEEAESIIRILRILHTSMDAQE